MSNFTSTALLRARKKAVKNLRISKNLTSSYNIERDLKRGKIIVKSKK